MLVLVVSPMSVFAWTTELPKKVFIHSIAETTTVNIPSEERFRLLGMLVSVFLFTVHLCLKSVATQISYFHFFFLFLTWVFQHAGMKDTHLEFWQIKMQPLCNLSLSIPRIHQMFFKHLLRWQQTRRNTREVFQVFSGIWVEILGNQPEPPCLWYSNICLNLLWSEFANALEIKMFDYTLQMFGHNIWFILFFSFCWMRSSVKLGSNQCLWRFFK